MVAIRTAKYSIDTQIAHSDKTIPSANLHNNTSIFNNGSLQWSTFRTLIKKILTAINKYTTRVFGISISN